MHIVKKLALASALAAAVAVSGIVLHGATNSAAQHNTVTVVADGNASGDGQGGEWPPSR
jgi:hypothetical protein